VSAGVSKRTAGDARQRSDALAAEIGARLKQLRGRADLSLEQLSQRAKVSRGMLSQIELGRSVPTIGVLSRIAAAFEIPVTVLVSPDPPGSVQVLRRNDASVLRSADSKFSSRALFPFRGARKSEFYELTLDPGCHYPSAAHNAGTTENLVVACGSIEVYVAGATHALGTGDALHFAADVPHAYGNPGQEVAVAYLVMAYPQPVSY
jgi:transcriptional regulator with XRE-family HTH domain